MAALPVRVDRMRGTIAVMTIDTTGTAARDGESRRGGPADSTFVRACRRESVGHTPVWFMRQAGRSLPEYREIRANVGMLDSCRRPDLVAEITLQPVRRHAVDAAILFSDIVVPVAAAGVDLDIVAGTGPVVAEPVRTAEDVERIHRIDRADVSYVDEAVRLLVAELGDTPLIGFAGAPFTLASYLVEGAVAYPRQDQGDDARPTRAVARALRPARRGDPGVPAGPGRRRGLRRAALRLVGRRAVRGRLPPVRAAALHHRAVRARQHRGAPDPLRGGHRRAARRDGEAGADVVGVDWRTPLDVATRRIGPDRAVQGNLDPTVLFAPWPVVEAEVRRIVEQGRAAPGHVFNLGHGVLPETDPEVLTRVVALVHEVSAHRAEQG